MISNSNQSITTPSSSGNVFLPNLGELRNLANRMGFELGELIKEFNLNVTTQQYVDEAVAFLSKAHKQLRKSNYLCGTKQTTIPDDQKPTAKGK